jgi:hypothetical protein
MTDDVTRAMKRALDRLNARSIVLTLNSGTFRAAAAPHHYNAHRLAREAGAFERDMTIIEAAAVTTCFARMPIAHGTGETAIEALENMEAKD